MDRSLEQLLLNLLGTQSRSRRGKAAEHAELLKRTSVAVPEILSQMSWSFFGTIMLEFWGYLTGCHEDGTGGAGWHIESAIAH